MSAEFELQEALYQDRDNVEYHLTSADLLWRKGMPDEARRQYEQVLKSAPDNAEAASGAARYFLFDMFRYLDMQSVITDCLDARLPSALLQDDVHVLALRSFGERDRDRALDYLNRALAANPDHKPSVARLCLLHYEDNRADSAVAVAGRYLERHPDDEDALLYQGLGYQAMGKLALAAGSYEKAMRSMPAGARAVMESLEEIASADEQKALAPGLRLAASWTETPGLTHFWGQRDPLLLTPFNERRMEHYNRVAYANLRFGLPEEGIPGWKTEQGQVYIRYGRYLGRTVLRPNEVGQIYHETWSYEGFNVTFQNWDGLDHWRFESYRSPAYPGPVSNMKDLYRRYPGRYLDPYEDKKYDLPHQVVAFTGGGRKGPP
ncbi:MAG: GWxTD domain-containing protein [Candidatus Latescibacteria bacterium]|nr:GWxTD domain-containing protein [Candidatus Latescibacterota bacterium]